MATDARWIGIALKLALVAAPLAMIALAADSLTGGSTPAGPGVAEAGRPDLGKILVLDPATGIVMRVNRK